MTTILQYAPWTKLYILTEKPFSAGERAKETGEAIRRGTLALLKMHEEGRTTISQEELDELFDVGFERKIYDVSKDIISGHVTLNINQLSRLTVTLGNANGKYLNCFMPNDRVILFLKRIKVLQVFTGYIDTVPVITGRKRESVVINASCTLKKLNNTFWNPNLSYIQDMIGNPTITPEELLHYLVEDIGRFHPADVYIQPFKDTEFWNMLVNYSTRANNLDFMTNAFGMIEFGSPSPGGTELTNGNIIDGNKLDIYLRNKRSPMAGYGMLHEQFGKQYNVNPALVVAIAGAETSFGTNPAACNNHGANYNYWGIKGRPSQPGGPHRTYSSMAEGLNAAYSLIAKYLTPGSSLYVDGTIRGMSGLWVNGQRGTVNESWTQRTTTFYTEIMNQCRKSGVVSGGRDTTVIDNRNPQTPEEEQRALRQRSQRIREERQISLAPDGMCFPLPKNVNYEYINDWHAQRTGHLHQGNDIRAPMNSIAVAVCNGRVSTYYHHKGGNIIYLTSTDGVYKFAYMHMATKIFPGLQDGSYVTAGQPIGLVGETGNAKGTTPHIHFEMWINGQRVNPYFFLISHDPKKNNGVGGVTLNQSLIDQYLNSGISGITDDSLNPIRMLENYKLGIISATMKGVYALAVTERLLKTILEVAKFGMYIITTDGTGRFIARWADFFGTEKDDKGHSGPHFRIEDIEIKNLSIYIDDTNLITHQFVIPDSCWDGQIDSNDWLAVGVMSQLGDAYTNAVQNITGGRPTEEDLNMVNPSFGIAFTAFHSPRLGIMNDSDWTPEEFIKKYGYRPAVDESLICKNKAQAQFMSEYLFKEKWANLVRGTIQTTFLPEVRPMMIVEIPKIGMQFFVESVTHTFGTTYGTEMNLKAGIFTDNRYGSRNPFLARIKKSFDEIEGVSLDKEKLNPLLGFYGPIRLPFSFFNEEQ